MNSRLGPSPKMVTVLVAGLVVVGLGLRVWILTSDLGAADADEAVVGLMAGDALSGDFEAFFWGQEYGGAHESIVVAGLLAAGLPEVLALKLAPMLFFAGAALVLWRVGRRLVPGPARETTGETVGRLAAGLFWAVPAGVVWMSTKERGFYGASLVFGLLVILLALRLDERWSTRDAAFLGGAVGAAWYASPQAGYLVLPALGWLGVRAIRRGDLKPALRSAPVVAGTAAVAALPWLVANLSSGFDSLKTPPGFPETSYVDRFELFFKRGLPIAFGARNAVIPSWIASPLGQALYIAIAIGVVVGVVLLVRRRVALGRWWLVVAAVALYPLLFSLFPSSFTITDVRYVTFLIPFLAVLAALGASRLTAAAVPIVIAALVGLSVAGTAQAIDAGGTPGLWDISPGDVDPLIEALEAEDIDRVFADYWIAHRLDFETEEDVVASPFELVRHQAYEEAVRKDERPAYVVFRGTENERTIGLYLGDHGIEFDRTDAGIYVIYAPRQRVVPEEVSPVWKHAPGRSRH